MRFKKKHEPYVAVMDTHDLESEVLVWHVPHLGVGQNHEYLAFGPIMGNRYHAVSLKVLERHGINNLFRKNLGRNGFDHALRERMFRNPSAIIRRADLDAFKVIGSLYGNLAFSVITALACLRPRVWRNWRESNGANSEWPDPQGDLAMFAPELKMDYVPPGLHEAP